jgi:hypothetical protein
MDGNDWHIFHEQLDRFIHALRLPSRPSPAVAIEHDGARESGHEVSEEFSRQRRTGPDRS